jgi:hypothetical protein
MFNNEWQSPGRSLSVMDIHNRKRLVLGFRPGLCAYMRTLTVSWRISTSFTRFSSAERPLGACIMISCEYVACKHVICWVLTIVRGKVSETDEPKVNESGRSKSPRPPHAGGDPYRRSSCVARYNSALSLFSPVSLSLLYPPFPLVLARPKMLFLWAFIPFILFATVTHALQSDRRLRHRLKTEFGHTTHHRRSLAGAAFTVKVVITVLPLPSRRSSRCWNAL